MFRHTITLNRVHDTITVKEGSDKLTLIVNGDAMRMVAGLNKAQQKMSELPDDATDELVKETANYFAAVIFGKDQADKLMDFYNNDPGCVISLCGQYFKNRLAKKITNVQKKFKA